MGEEIMGQELFHVEPLQEWVDLGKGVQRKVAVYTDDLMLVKVRFEKGAVGELHQHPHVQTSYVSAGRFKYVIGDQECIIAVGDSCIIPPNIIHGCECIEAGELIDSFTPKRDDFLI